MKTICNIGYSKKLIEAGLQQANWIRCVENALVARPAGGVAGGYRFLL